MASSNCFLPKTITSSPFSKDSGIPVQPALYRRTSAFPSFLLNVAILSSRDVMVSVGAVSVGNAVRVGVRLGVGAGVELGVAVGIGSPVSESILMTGRVK